MRKLLLLLLLQCCITVMADKIGDWKIYSCYNDISEIAPAGNDIFVVASGNLYSYNMENSIQTYDKTNCLSSSDITHIAWVPAAGKLVVTYSDYYIDLVKPTMDVEFIDELANKQTTYDKAVNSIYVSDKYAYLSTKFGIIKVDAKEGYIADTYNLGFDVDYCYIEGDYLYAESPTEGKYRGLLKANLLDKNNWVQAGNYTPKQKETYIHDTKNSCYWAQGEDSRLTQYKKQNDDSFKPTGISAKPDGPACNSFWRIYKNDGKIFSAPGIFAAGMNIIQDGCVQYLDIEKNEWTELENPLSKLASRPHYNVMNCMAFDPDDKNHFWVGTFYGLFEYKDYKIVKRYNEENSSLLTYFGNAPGCTHITSMAYDNDHNLWVGNGWCDVALHCYRNDGTWKAFPQEGYNMDNLNTIDEQGIFYSTFTKSVSWVHSYYFDGVLFNAYNNGEDIAASKDFVSEDKEKLEFEYIYGLTEDKENNLWFATTRGPVYMRPEERIRNGNTLVKHKVPRNDGTNLADYLLNDISVRCIKVDAANRKWMGTSSNGVFLISSDNNTQVEHFTTENSPLLSNTVYDILIDDETGVVYFATDKGLCSYQGDMSEANTEWSDDNVYAYPNPVTPDYTGEITIAGIMDRANIKITNSAGFVVNEGVSMGGSYKWNGRDLYGNKVSSGVYMVMVASEEGENCLTKIAIVR